MADRNVVEQVQERVRASVAQHGLIVPGATVVVAVSGGADSLCLLHVLDALASEFQCRLHVAHLDHALRIDSAGDARFVVACAERLGLPCTVEREDVRALAEREGLSIETAARHARYAFLRRTASSCPGKVVIATGHTRDDQAETLLLHLARGSGLNGLAGMRPRRGDLIRPLLDLTHAETVAYCAAVGLQPREDESNRSLDHARNRIRHAVLPALARVHPEASAALARAARLLSADLALIERLARGALEAAVVQRAEESVTLSPERWAEAEPELQPHMARLLVGDLLGHTAGFDETQYRAMVRAMQPGNDNAARTLALPRGLWLWRYGAVVRVGFPAPDPSALERQVLPVPGYISTPSGVLRAEHALAPHDWTSVPPQTAYLDPAALGPAPVVRGWQQGDRVRPLGLGGTRKLQDVFVDRKVPRRLRRSIPIVEGTRGIAWVAGIVVSEDYRVASGSPAIRIIWEPHAGVLNAWRGV